MPRTKPRRGPGRPPADPVHGDRFHRMLTRSNLSLRDIGDALGLTRQNVHKWTYRGVPPVHVVRVATLLGCSVEYLRPDVYRDLDDRR